MTRFLLLLAALCVTRLPAEEPAADPPVYEEVTPPARLEHIQLLGPRRVYLPTAHFRLTFPRRPYPLPDLPEEGTRDLTATLHLRHQSADLTATQSIPLSFRPNGQLHNVHVLNLEVELTDWPDGDVTAHVRLPELPEEANLLPPPLTFRIVRETLDTIAPEHHDEMHAWLDDANQLSTIWGKRPLWPTLDQALTQPDDPWENLRGFLLRAYENPQLQRHQPYTLYIPESLDLSEPVPLMILLHGSGGDYRNLIADYAAGQRFETHPMLIANAGAFPNLEFRHLALNNVEWIIEDVARKYRIDRDRIYAQGISLGGRGVLDLAAHLPDRFAAVSSQGTYGIHRTLLDPLHAAQTDPVAYQLAARNDIRTWMPNLATTPVEMVFGWSDTSTRPVGALAIAAVLQTLGNRVVERGFDLGHNLTLPDYDWASTREWFLQHQKDRWPLRLHFRVANLRHNRYAWIRVDALHDYTGVGEVRARIGPDMQLVLETHNIAKLTYLPPPIIHERASQFPAGVQVFHFDPQGQPLPAPPDDPNGPAKHPGQSGPLWNFFGDPFLIVWDDTIEDPAIRHRLQNWANNTARLQTAPGPHTLPVTPVSSVEPDALQTHNILWFTTPDSTHSWRETIPVPLPEAAKDILNQERINLLALRPSPWADNHMVLVAEDRGGQFTNLLQMHFFQEHLQPDWVIVQGRVPLAAGSYNHDWTPGPMTTESYITRILTR